ncbi:MAG: glycosyltransferase family 87 protein [Acidobacteriota bacterium]
MLRTILLTAAVLFGALLDYLFLKPLIAQPTFDFAQYYFAGQLVADGKIAQIYDREAYRPLIAAVELPVDKRSKYYNRPAAWALLCWPLSFFSYETAGRLFIALNFVLWGALIWNLPLWLKAPKYLRVWLVSLYPFAFSVGVGQDTLAITLVVAYSLCVLLEENQPLAGILLGLCLVKPHVIMLLPLLLLMARKYRAFFWFCVTGMALAGASFLLVGIQGTQQWFDLLRAPTTDLFTADMANFRALSVRLGLPLTVFAGMMVLASGAVTLTRGTYMERLSVLLVLSLLLSPHTYWQDYSLLSIVALGTSNRFIRYTILLPWGFFAPTPAWPIAACTLGFLFLMAIPALRSRFGSPNEARREVIA